MPRARNNFLALLLLMSLGFAEAGEKLTFVGDEWPPFNNALDAASEGYFIDIARAIYEPLGYEVNYHVVPWKRSVRMVKSGHFNALLGPFKSEAPGFIFPDEEIGRVALSFFTRASSKWVFAGLDSLKGKKIGIVQDYDYRPWLQKYRKKHPDSFIVLAGQTATENNMKLLLRNRIDIIPSNEPSFLYRAKKAGDLAKIRLAGRDNIGESKKLYIAFSPNDDSSAKYASIFSQGLRQLRVSGKLNTILEKYGLIDWR